MTQIFLAFIEDDIENGLVDVLESGIQKLQRSRQWRFPPTFVHEIEPASTPGDDDIVTLGAYIDLSSATGDESDSLNDAEAFVQWWKMTSATLHKTIGFELNGDGVGWIDDGDASDLEAGMLQPWRAKIDAS